MRSHVEILDSLSMIWQPSSLFPGTKEKVLSHDPITAASTLLLHLPAAWSASSWSSVTEIFVLAGSLCCGALILTEGCYSFRPLEPLRCGEQGALLLAMTDVFAGEPIPCLDTLELPWQSPAEGSAPGLVLKQLRHHDTSQTFLAGAVPLWCEREQEIHHHAREEGFLIRGEDTLMGQRGIMKPGSYFFRPQGIAHGPIATASGALYFFRSFGPFSLERLPAPTGTQPLSDYFKRFPLYSPE